MIPCPPPTTLSIPRPGGLL